MRLRRRRKRYKSFRIDFKVGGPPIIFQAQNKEEEEILTALASKKDDGD